jgi:Protein of unknown function (DUF3593)
LASDDSGGDDVTRELYDDGGGVVDLEKQPPNAHACPNADPNADPNGQAWELRVVRLELMLELIMSKETLFALSLFPYLGFLWFLGRSQQAPKRVLLGFWLLLVFVAVTIPAGIYAKVAYGQELANVDWLHGGAESFLTISNMVVVLGFYGALREET